MDLKLTDHLISSAAEGIIATDLEGTILQYNRTSIQMLSYSPGELEGQFIGSIFPPQSTLHLVPNLMRLAREGSGFTGEILLRSRMSEDIIVRLRADCFPEDDPECILFRFLDWREVKGLLQDLRDTSQLAILGQLTRSAAHEILNPITAIGGYARKLGESVANGTREAEWADQITSNVQVLEYLIRTMQNFITLPAPSFQLGSLEKILDESISKVKEQLGSRGIQLTRDGAKEFPRIYIDPDLLGKAFTAVLLNGIERMPNGGTLVISAHSDGQYHRMNVDDTGPSLKPHQIEDDLSPLHVMRALGTDLNLAIANRIIEDHGGDMDLTSTDPSGLRVTLTLPLDRRKISRTILT